jgi:Hsp70 protein
VPTNSANVGGDDINQVVFDIIREKHPAAVARLADESDPSTLRDKLRFLELCEQIKCELSEKDSYAGPIPPLMLEAVTVSRAELERRIEPLLRETIDACDQLIADAGLNWSQVDLIAPVGGSSQIPLIPRLLYRHSGRQILPVPEPELAVVRGAARLAVSVASGSRRGTDPAGTARPTSVWIPGLEAHTTIRLDSISDRAGISDPANGPAAVDRPPPVPTASPTAAAPPPVATVEPASGPEPAVGGDGSDPAPRRERWVPPPRAPLAPPPVESTRFRLHPTHRSLPKLITGWTLLVLVIVDAGAAALFWPELAWRWRELAVAGAVILVVLGIGLVVRSRRRSRGPLELSTIEIRADNVTVRWREVKTLTIEGPFDKRVLAARRFDGSAGLTVALADLDASEADLREACARFARGRYRP